MTQQEVANKLGISRSYVSRIEKKALTKLKERFKSEDNGEEDLKALSPLTSIQE